MVDRLVNSEVNTRRVQNVEQCFGSKGKTLQAFGRVLVGEGVLTKICRKGPKKRQFFLFNDILVYGSIVTPKKKYHRQHIIQLHDIILEDLKDDGAAKNGWLIKTPAKSFAVYAATSNEKSEWMIHIDRCVQEVLAKDGKRRPDMLAAVWVPDKEAARCMSCGRTQFSFLQRRHHCRACGNVVCRACSSHSIIIASIKKTAVRVCDRCLDKLSSGNSPILSLPPLAVQNDSGDNDTSGDSDDDVKEDDLRPTFYRERGAS